MTTVRAAILLICLACLRIAAAQAIPYQRPVQTAPQQDTIGGGYKTPPVQKPLPRDSWLQVLDVVAAGRRDGRLGLAGAQAPQPQSGWPGSRVGSLAYFGFYREGCICPIGSIQNVAVALTDPALLHPHGGDGDVFPAAGGGAVLRPRLLRRRLPARRDSGTGGAEAGPGAAPARPRAGPAEVRLSRAGDLLRRAARPGARFPDLPVRSVRRLLPPHRRAAHAHARAALSGCWACSWDGPTAATCAPTAASAGVRAWPAAA